MNIKMLKAALAGLVLSISGFANAGIIDYGYYTEDTSTDLAFLDLNLAATDTYANYLNGITYNGFNWELATVDQFTMFLSNGTGTVIPTWNGSNLSDFNLNAINLATFLTTFSGSTSTGWFTLNGENEGQASAYVHTGFNDIHLQNSSVSYKGLFVRSTQVPEPSTLAIFAIGILGLVSRRLKAMKK